MKYLKITIIIFLFSNTLLAQENYVNLNETEKEALQAKVDTLLKQYYSFTNFSLNGEADMIAVDKYKRLFDSEKSKVFDDLNLSYTDNTVTIQSYITDISLDFSSINDDLFDFQYQRKIEFDSIRHYKKQKYYYTPVKLQKLVKYQLNESGEITKSNKLISLELYINYYEESDKAKIVGIFEDLDKGIKWTDCEGVENGTATIGSSCNDGKDLTDNDAYQFDCKCSGNCIATLGEACNDDNELTINDVYRADCTCAGVCEETLGDTCDDGNDLTINDAYQADCSCAGTCEVEVDAPCDDGNDLTINDVYQSDCSCKGGCEGGAGEPCDDGNLLTNNDVYQADCACAGTCEGNAGEPCDDDNSLTINDVYQADCTCAGTCNVKEGEDCDDSNEDTYDDKYNSDCECIGEKKPVFVDCEGIENGPYVPGYECDDKNDNTINDRYRDDCKCRGDIQSNPPDFKKISFGIVVGPIIQIPLLNSNNNANFSDNLNYGVKLAFDLTPPKNEKVNFQAGIAFLQINQNYNLGDYNDKLHIENVQISSENMDSLGLELNGISETFNLNVLQIPLGVSYNLISNSKNNIFVDVFAKPNIILGEPNYTLEASQEKNLFTNSFGTSLALADLDNNNSIIEEAKIKGYMNSIKLDLSSANTNMNSLPIAVGGGLSYAYELAENSFINAYVHYNYFIIPISWEESSEQENIEDSKIINILINSNELPIDEDFIPLSNYFDVLNNANIELGITYRFKF